MKENERKPLRRQIVVTLTVCLALAMAPWFAGGRQPVAMLVSTCALLLAGLLAWVQPQVRLLKWGALAASFAVLMAYGLLSLAWSANHYSTVLWVTRWALAGMAFVVAYKLAVEEKGREWVVRAYMLSAMLFCVVALVMFELGSFAKLTGTFFGAGAAAAYLMPAIVIGWDRLRKAHGRRLWLWVAAQVVFLAAFMLASSVGAMVILASLTAVYLAVVQTSRAYWTIIVFALGIGFAASLGLADMNNVIAHRSSNPDAGSRYTAAIIGEPRGAVEWLQYTQSAARIWLEHPLTGTGAGTYGDVHTVYQQHVESGSNDVHNIYVQTLAELGLAGLAALMSVLLWLAAGVLRGLVSEPEMLAIGLSVAGLVLLGGIEAIGAYPAILILAAALAGAVYRPRQAAYGRASLLVPVGAALMLAPVTSWYFSDTWMGRAQLAQEDGDYSYAAERFASAHGSLVFDPDSVTGEGISRYIMAFGGLDKKSNLQLALDRAHQAERLDPYDGRHYQLEGRVLVLEGKSHEALQVFAKALTLDKYNPGFGLDLASAQAQAGKPETSVKTALSVLSLYPDQAIRGRTLGVGYRPALADLEALVGNAYLSQGKVREAGIAASRSLKFYASSLRGRALKHQVDKIQAPASSPPKVTEEQ